MTDLNGYGEVEDVIGAHRPSVCSRAEAFTEFVQGF